MSSAARNRADRAKGQSPTVVLGVGAGIAAYKVAHVVRDLRRADVVVHVIPTEASTNFVGLQTWQELSENPVATEIFHGPEQLSHIELARIADLFVVAPATADLLAKLRAGMASDLLTATFLAAGCPKLLVPAMHTQMWENPATQENVEVLRQRGIAVLEPATGRLSSGDTGAGRLPEPETIAEVILQELDQNAADEGESGRRAGPLVGQRVVVTAGGTLEPIDPVRFIGNRSSGSQGIELARAAAQLGADVTLLAANVTVPLPVESGIDVVQTPTAVDMLAAVERVVPNADALFMAAAVADYRPEASTGGKLKKEEWGSSPQLQLVENPDILRSVAVSADRPRILVGFAAETGPREQVLRLGQEKARRKGADLLAINQVGEDKGFGEVENTLTVVDEEGDEVASFSGTKTELAYALVNLAFSDLSQQ